MGKPLTNREQEVTRWLREGKSSTMIAQIMGISRRTVEKHCENIYAKLGVNGRIGVFWHLLDKARDGGGSPLLLPVLVQFGLGSLGALALAE